MAFSISAFKISVETNKIYYRYTGCDNIYGTFAISMQEFGLIDIQPATNDQNQAFLRRIAFQVIKLAKNNANQFPDHAFYQA